MNHAALLALFSDPADAGRRALAARDGAFGAQIQIRSTPAHPAPTLAALIQGERIVDLSPAPGPEGHVAEDMSREPRWPDPASLRPGDRLVLAVDHDQLPAYCAWLLRAAAAAPGWSLAPFCPRPGGLFRLHLIAAARLALPAGVRVEVRHDLVGVRLAQVALQFGADTLAGPQDAGRHLPLAGVPRPSETSAMALAELVRQAGFEPQTSPLESP